MAINPKFYQASNSLAIKLGMRLIRNAGFTKDEEVIITSERGKITITTPINVATQKQNIELLISELQEQNEHLSNTKNLSRNLDASVQYVKNRDEIKRLNNELKQNKSVKL